MLVFMHCPREIIPSFPPKSGYRWGPPGQMSSHQTPQTPGITGKMLASGWSSERQGRLKRRQGPFSHTVLPSVSAGLRFCLPQIGLPGSFSRGNLLHSDLGSIKVNPKAGNPEVRDECVQGLLSLSFPIQRMEIIKAKITTIISLGTPGAVANFNYEILCKC